MCHRSCEGQRGIFQIHSVPSQKVVKTLPDSYSGDVYTSQEVVASAFHPKNEQMVITLSGLPELTLIMWHWEQGKVFAKETIAVKNMNGDAEIPYQLSYNPMDLSYNTMLITGPSTFVYLRLSKGEETEYEFNVVHS